MCPRFFRFGPSSGQKWRFLVKKWSFFGGGSKMSKTNFFFLVHLFIFESSRRESALGFFIFGPLVAKNCVFRYRAPNFGGQKTQKFNLTPKKVKNEKSVLANLIIFKSSRKHCTLAFFIFGPLRPQIGKKLDFGRFCQFLKAYPLAFFQK